MANDPKKPQVDNTSEINRQRTEHLADKGAAAPVNAPRQADNPGGGGSSSSGGTTTNTNTDQQQRDQNDHT